MNKREGWGPGPWDGEPDRELFQAHGFDCLARRGPLGAWCGYVAVLPGHPYYELGYNDVPVDVHGGLTYAEHCHGEVCHPQAEGKDDKVWWLGFDCGHYEDLVPGVIASMKKVGVRRDWPATYRTLAYVKEEIMCLAQQLKEAKL